MPRSEDIYLRFTGTHTAAEGTGGTETITTLQFPTAGARVWLLTSFHYKPGGSGGAANYAPSLHQASTAATDSINERMNVDSAVVAIIQDIIFAAPIPCMTDTSGRLYFKPGFDTSSDNNDGVFEFWFKKGRGATKTV